MKSGEEGHKNVPKLFFYRHLFTHPFISIFQHLQVPSGPFPSHLTPYDVSAHIKWCEMTFSAFRNSKFRIWRLVLWDVLRFLHLDLLGVLRTLVFYINFRQLAINGHSYCVLAHASPLSVLKHALERKCSLMATPS